jgi:hypothetical protein|nr:MAG TPA: tail sheath protein [Caudoviricetes sp.]
MRPFGSKSDGKTLQLVQRGTDKRIPVELVKQPTGEVLDPAELEELSVKVASESEAGCASVPHSVEDGKLVVEVTAEVTRQLGLGVYTLTATGRIPDEAYADGYHDYEIVVDLCKVTKYGSNETPVKVQANVLVGLKGKDGKSAYEIAVKHGYQGTEEQFAKDIIPKSNYERAKELQGFQGTEEEYLDSLHGAPGKDLYQAAVERGYSGSFDDFLEKQKGAPGAPGKSLYELAQEDGFTGTLTEFLASKKGEKGKDAYDDYLETTTDNPKLTREEWADPNRRNSNNGNAEEGMNKTEIELLYKLNNGTDESATEDTTAGAQLMEADGHRRDIIRAIRAKGISVADTDGLTDLAGKIQEIKVYVIPVYARTQFGLFKGGDLPTLEVYAEFNPADFSNMFANSTSLKALPEIRNAGQISTITNMCSWCVSMTTATLPDLPAVTVANGAFYGCTSLETLTIGAMPRCTTMASLATTCASLKTITLGESPNVTEIAQIAYGCSSLTEVTIGTGDSLTKVDNAFNGCSRLRRINGTLDFTKLASTANIFFGCEALEEVRIKGLKVDLSLQQSTNLSTESVKYLVDNLQQVTGKSITIPRAWQTAHTAEAREYSQKAAAKGFTLNFR